MQFCHTHDFAQKTCSPHLRLQSLTSNLDVPGDGSCFVSFDELRHVARITLAIPPSELAEARLRALWCLLDGDDSNAILMEEIAPFLNGQIDRLLQSKVPLPKGGPLYPTYRAAPKRAPSKRTQRVNVMLTANAHAQRMAQARTVLVQARYRRDPGSGIVQVRKPPSLSSTLRGCGPIGALPAMGGH